VADEPHLPTAWGLRDEFFALRAASRAEKERAENYQPLPCRLAACPGAPVALQQSRILPASMRILSCQERSRILR